MRTVGMLALVVLISTGCSFRPSGMNSQRSALRGLGDSAVTVSLDSIQNDITAEATKKKVKEVAIAVQLFLKDGKLADLTLPEFTEALRKLVPEDYKFLFDILIAQVQSVQIPIGAIGANNIERINSACVGLIFGCDLYDMKYRLVQSQPATVDKAVVPPAEKVAAFGKRLKREMRVR